MRLVTFLIALLEAQAQTLSALLDLFGEEILVQMLEAAGERAEEAEEQGTALDLPYSRIEPEWFESNGPVLAAEGVSPYAEIKGAVMRFKLPSRLEFHLWAYPHYRSLVESAADLNSRICSDPEVDAPTKLADQAVAAAQAWIQSLLVPAEFQKQVHSAAQAPWIRFRAEILKRSGKKPLGAVE